VPFTKENCCSFIRHACGSRQARNCDCSHQQMNCASGRLSLRSLETKEHWQGIRLEGCGEELAALTKASDQSEDGLAWFVEDNINLRRWHENGSEVLSDHAEERLTKDRALKAERRHSAQSHHSLPRKVTVPAAYLRASLGSHYRQKTVQWSVRPDGLRSRV